MELDNSFLVLGPLPLHSYTNRPNRPMYRILYYSADYSAYMKLKKNLCPAMKLTWFYDSKKIEESVVELAPHALVFSITYPNPDLLQKIRRIIEKPQAPGVIVMAQSLTVSQVVYCMRQGVYDCFDQMTAPDILMASLDRLLEERVPPLSHRGSRLLEGQSLSMKDLLSRLQQYAPLPYPVLITGETGSGKDLVAKTLHLWSARSEGPFIPINCASFPDTLLESELFGTSRGAFTNSVDRPGRFEQADGGTLFLDEIGDLSLSGQACLLRVIEEKLICRLGSNKRRPVDVRLLAATNRNLREMIKKNLFRSDLFYRLNLLTITTPPLRKRREDIPQLVRSYLAKTLPDKNWRLNSSSWAKLARYQWPGNVRELQSVILRASLRARTASSINVRDIIFE